MRGGIVFNLAIMKEGNIVYCMMIRKGVSWTEQAGEDEWTVIDVV